MGVKNNRPRGRLDSQSFVDQESFLDEAFRGEYSAGNLIYKGFSRPGSLTSEPVWQIAKISYSGSSVTAIQWPCKEDAAGAVSPIASSDYEFIWDDRATYTYV